MPEAGIWTQILKVRLEIFSFYTDSVYLHRTFRKETQKLQVDPSFAPTLHIASFCAVLLTYLLNIVIVGCNYDS